MAVCRKIRYTVQRPMTLFIIIYSNIHLYVCWLPCMFLRSLSLSLTVETRRRRIQKSINGSTFVVAFHKTHIFNIRCIIHKGHNTQYSFMCGSLTKISSFPKTEFSRCTPFAYFIADDCMRCDIGRRDGGCSKGMNKKIDVESGRCISNTHQSRKFDYR